MKMMRRLLAAVLTVVLLAEPCLQPLAAAAGITLPASLTRIDAEAFSGVGGLEELILPYGMQEIGSRAFADSPLERIYIPATVTTIADDAFDGTVYPQIVSPRGSYAHTYAEAHDIDWVDAEDYYTEASMEAGIALLEENDQQPINQVMPSLSEISTEGVTDPGELSEIDQINQMIRELSEADQAYDDELTSLLGSWQTMAEEVAACSFTIQGDEITMCGSNLQLTISPESYEVLDENWELESVASSGNTVQYGIIAGEKHCYLTVEGSGCISFTAAPKLANAKAVEELSEEELAAFITGKDLLSDTMQKIQTFGTRVKNSYEVFQSAFTNALSSAQSSWQEAENVYKKHQASGTAETMAGRNARSAMNARRLRLDALRVLQPKLYLVNGFLAGWTLGTDINNFMEMQSIRGHGHPTAADRQDPQLLAEAQRLPVYITAAQAAYATDAALCVMDLISLLSTVAAAASSAVPGVGWAAAVAELLTAQTLKLVLKALIKEIAKKIALSITTAAAESAVNKSEAILHGYAHGQVKEWDTSQPLAGVLVQCGGKSVKTDKNGEFTIQSSGTATYTKNGYESCSAALLASPADNIILLYPLARLTGTVTYRSTGQPAAGIPVQIRDEDPVTTDANGRYTLETSAGDAVLTFNRGQANEETRQLTLRTHMTNVCNIELTRQAIIRGSVWDADALVPLAGVTVSAGEASTTTDSSGSYSLTMEAGTGTVTFSLAGYETRSLTYSLTAGSDCRVDAPMKKRTNFDYRTFGRYEQDNDLSNGPEPIEWLVLEVRGNQALLLSKYGLDRIVYDVRGLDVTWETCILRSWLNGEFLNTAFTAEEQAAIRMTPVDNSQSQCFDFTTVRDWAEPTYGGNNTLDKIFLLSYAEANRYLGVRWYEESGAMNNVIARVSPTAYAGARGAYTEGDYTTSEGAAAGFWWLRSPGCDQDHAAIVSYAGSLGFTVVYDIACVRPALWVNLGS